MRRGDVRPRDGFRAPAALQRGGRCHDGRDSFGVFIATFPSFELRSRKPLMPLSGFRLFDVRKTKNPPYASATRQRTGWVPNFSVLTRVGMSEKAKTSLAPKDRFSLLCSRNTNSGVNPDFRPFRDPKKQRSEVDQIAPAIFTIQALVPCLRRCGAQSERAAQPQAAPPVVVRSHPWRP